MLHSDQMLEASYRPIRSIIRKYIKCIWIQLEIMKKARTSVDISFKYPKTESQSDPVKETYAHYTEIRRFQIESQKMDHAVDGVRNPIMESAIFETVFSYLQ